MIDKIINSKISWIVLVTILIILIISVIFISKPTKNIEEPSKIIENEKKENEKNNDDNDDNDNKNEDLVTLQLFELKGFKVMKLTEGEEYKEVGFVAFDSENNDLTEFVKVEGNVDVNKPGIYKIKYTLPKYNKELIRTIEIVEKAKPNIKLIGDSEIYIKLNDEYKDPGIQATLNENDISDKVNITGNINSKEPGIYTITYSYDTIKVERKVIVFDLDSLFNVKNETDKSIVNISLNNNFKYVKLPDNTLNYNKAISFIITQNGSYTFNVYMSNNQEFEKIININSIKNIIKVSGIKINEKSQSLYVSKSKKLSYTISPNNATNKKVIWSSSNNKIVSVTSDGTIKALKEGTATIKVTTEDGAFTSSCKITVKKKTNSLYNSNVHSKYTLKSGNKYVLKKEANNKTYVTVKTSIEGVLSSIGKQGSDQCRTYSINYVNNIFKKTNITHTSSSRLRTSDTQTILSIMATELMKGRPTVIRVTGMKKDKNKYSRHYVTVVGILETANLNKLKETDFLILDPHGYIRQLGRGTKGDGTKTSGRYLLNGKDKKGSPDNTGFQVYIWTNKNTYLKSSKVMEDPS